MFLVFFAAAGDPAPLRNEAHYLCRLKHFWDPAWCQGDLFLESPDAHFTVVWLFGWVTRLVSLETTAWLGRIASWALIAWGWRRVVARVTPLPFMAPLGAALLVYLTEQGHFAGEWMIGGFESKTLAYGLVLLALSLAIDGRWNLAWGLLGAASALHALVGGWSVVALGLAWAWARSKDQRGPPLRSMAPGLAIGGLLALAGVVPGLMLNLDTPREIVAEGNQAYVFQRLSHHLAPLTKPRPWLVDRAGRHLAVIAVLAWLHARLRKRDAAEGDDALRLLVRFAWGAEAISLAGLTIEVLGWNSPAWAAGLLRYYWFRLADIAAPIAIACLALAELTSALDRRRAHAPAIALGLVAVGAYQVGGHVFERLASPAAEGDAYYSDPASWVAMCRWIEANTEPDALFLTPRRSHSFKWHAGRAEVVTYKDVPQNAEGLVEWRDRYADVFQIGTWKSGKPRWTPSVAELGGARLRELAEQYGALYALSHDAKTATRPGLRRRVSLPIVHAVGPFTLYDLRPTTPPSSPRDDR